MTIPVISVAVISSTYWVQRLIASIDFPVDNFAIYNNSENISITEDLEKIVKLNHPYIKKFSLINFPHNIGLPAVWNLTIKCYIKSPYWLFVNDDVSFTPGFLEEMFNQAQDNEVGIVHGGPGDFNDGAWDVFIIKDWVIQSHGLFEENCYPAYAEDVDYIMRIHNSPIKRITSINKVYYHGLGTDYNITGQQTKKSNPHLEAKLNFIQWSNHEYMTKKWGHGWTLTNPSSLSFDKFPLDYTTFDLQFCRTKYLDPNERDDI